MKINRIRASMIATLSFFFRNIYNNYIVLLAQCYTNLLSPDGVHPQISSSLCFVRPDFFCFHYCLFIFSKELISFMGSLDKCHTSVFNGLIITCAVRSSLNLRASLAKTIGLYGREAMLDIRLHRTCNAVWPLICATRL